MAPPVLHSPPVGDMIGGGKGGPFGLGQAVSKWMISRGSAQLKGGFAHTAVGISARAGVKEGGVPRLFGPEIPVPSSLGFFLILIHLGR